MTNNTDRDEVRRCSCGARLRGTTTSQCIECRRRNLYRQSYSYQGARGSRSPGFSGFHCLISFSQSVSSGFYGFWLILKGIGSALSLLYAALLECTAVLYSLRSKHHDYQRSFGREASRHEQASDRCYDIAKNLRAEASRLRDNKTYKRDEEKDQNE